MKIWRTKELIDRLTSTPSTMQRPRRCGAHAKAEADAQTRRVAAAGINCRITNNQPG